MNSFGILDFALPFGAVALVILCWTGISRLSSRRASHIATGGADTQPRDARAANREQGAGLG